MRDSQGLPPRQGIPADRQVHDIVHILTRPWSFHIMSRLLRDGPIRFGLLLRDIRGISKRLLTHRLHQFEAHGLVVRIVEKKTQKKMAYDATRRTMDLVPCFTFFHEIVDKWKKDDLIPDRYRHARSPIDIPHVVYSVSRNKLEAQ